MTVPDAMQTTFEGTGPTTHVTIAREMAEADAGRAFKSDEEFAGWIDDNNNRIYDAAVTKRERKTEYESVTLMIGDLPSLSVEPSQDAVNGETEAARVIAIGEPVDAADPLFVGSLNAAFEHVLRRDLDYRSSVIVWTKARIYSEDDFEKIRHANAVDD